MTAANIQEVQTQNRGTSDETVPTLQVLLVDDDSRYLMLCKRYLKRSKEGQFNIHTASTVKEAISMYQNHVYDCMVVDYILPDGTGIDFITSLDRSSSKKVPPAIVTTSDGGEDAATEAIRAGAKDYLSKRNLNSQSLSRCIYNAVEKSQLAESLKQRNVELVKANKNLEQNRNEITHFYHTVSHEVKTPLAAAREFVSLVRDGAEGEVTPGQYQLLQHAIDSCDQIKKQFTELLEITRLENGKLKISRSATGIDSLIARSISSVSKHARDKHVSIQQVVKSGIEVHADSDRIVQVLSNLLHNAVKFSHEGGEIILRTCVREQGEFLEIQVEDLVAEFLIQS